VELNFLLRHKKSTHKQGLLQQKQNTQNRGVIGNNGLVSIPKIVAPNLSGIWDVLVTGKWSAFGMNHNLEKELCSFEVLWGNPSKIQLSGYNKSISRNDEKFLDRVILSLVCY
jgi:hypothetical protein